jgi:predicted component of type VI protein secretion system
MAGMVVEVVEGPDAGRRIELDRAIELGRGDDAGFVLNDPQASRRHARIRPATDGAVVEDLGSTNGTFLNGNPVYGPTIMSPGDTVLIGLSVLELRTADVVARQGSAVRPVPPALAVPPQQPDYLLPAAARDPAPDHELDRLLDVRVKAKARLAPLAILIVVVLAVLVFLATRS